MRLKKLNRPVKHEATLARVRIRLVVVGASQLACKFRRSSVFSERFKRLDDFGKLSGFVPFLAFFE